MTEGQETDKLFDAIEKQNREKAAEALRNGADINGYDRFSLTPLHRAVATKNVPMIQMLLAQGADVTLDGPRGTPLDEALSMSGFEEITRLLRKAQKAHPSSWTAKISPSIESTEFKRLLEKRVGDFEYAMSALNETQKEEWRRRIVNFGSDVFSLSVTEEREHGPTREGRYRRDLSRDRSSGRGMEK